MLTKIEDNYYMIRDNILNNVATWCIKHCCCSSEIYFTLAKKVFKENGNVTQKIV
jgi:hypothetical protein